MNIIKSPLTLKGSIEILHSINTKELIQLYYSSFKIDVSDYFKNIDKIFICKDVETELMFYYPNISGDSFFYEQLQDFDWYYMPWKWEHENTVKQLGSEYKLLEIGCGSGGFLKKVKNKVSEVTGLELNKKIINAFSDSEIPIYNESIKDHVKKKQGYYDVVCLFQVLEHIVDLKDFIEDIIKAVKVGGKIIISVPNNDSFIKLKKNILNMPPHHNGLWNKKALISLSKLFDLKIIDISYSPLQKYHYKYFADNVYSHLRNKIFISKYIPAKFTKFLILYSRYVLSNKFVGFDIQVTYIKK